MNRTVPRRVVLLGLSCWIALAAGLATAEEPTPAGVRVFYTGHSFHMFVPAAVEQMVKSAGIKGHQLAGTQGIGGSRVLQHWELNEGQNKARQILESGRTDVFTMAAHLAMPDPGIENFAELGLKHNPQLRLLVQASWMPFDAITPGSRIRDAADREQTNLDELQAATDRWRGELEEQVDELNKRHGRTALFIVPAGDAVMKLRRSVAAGKFPGISKQADLFRDLLGHGLGQIRVLVSYCNYSAIYGKSPEGLKVVEPGVSDDQHPILQRIAWETVSNYPRAGIKK